jgi:peptidoglycan hydrolase-like protein with peptidoglycan-binding domain
VGAAREVPFAAAKHPRAAGGRFQATGAAQAAANGRPAGPWAAGPVRKGAGHRGAPDPRVEALQRQLNALGITDERGRPLLVDGIDGNHTTAAVKKWQKAHGLAPTGEIDAKTMVAILSDKPKPKKTARSMMSSRSGKRTNTSTPAKKPKAAPPYADRGPGFSRFGSGSST